MEILNNKNILILVSGSIAIYKTLQLISDLKKLGANIAVVMSEGAKKFINPIAFECMSNREVLHANNESFISLESPNHINYAKWAHIAILAPATTNTIAKLRCGINDNVVLNTIFALECTLLIAPSANINMMESKQNEENLKALKAMGYIIIPPRTTLLACNVIANGAMADICEIIFNIKKAIYKNSFWENKNIVITGGGSIEDIDPVRNISNASSGLQASYLAEALYYAGANITLISSKFPIPLPLEIKKIKVRNTDDYQKAILNEDKSSILIMAAAISDYIPIEKSPTKMKKSEIGEILEIKLKQNIDLLKEANFAFKIAFKAEDSNDSNAIKNASNLLKPQNEGGKNCDIVLLNLVSYIGSMDNEIIIIDKNGSTKLESNTKFNLSFQIVSYIQNILQKYLSKDD